MKQFETNPFDRAALTDHKQLAGRKNEFQQIRFILRNASKQKTRIKNILISGNRGVGKTSLLNLIEKECLSNNLVPVRISLTDSNSVNSNEFFWHIFQQTISSVFTLGLMGGPSGAIDVSIQQILYL